MSSLQVGNTSKSLVCAKDMNHKLHRDTTMNLPGSPLELYVQIYCKRKKLKDRDKNILNEATKSWATLTETEKLHFTDKYKEFQNKYRNKFATYLKDVNPYLKKKRCKGLSYKESNKETERTVKTPVNDEIDNTSEHNCLQYGNQTVFSDEDRENINYFQERDHPAVENYSLLAPDPPKIKSGKELYNMIQEKSNNGTELWSSLPICEKIKYQKAASTMKCNYIKNFVGYLESLPPEQLFNYYNKYCFE